MSTCLVGSDMCIRDSLSTINNAINIAQKESQKQMNAVTGGMLGDMKIPGL